jgi:hypothetical protein
MIFKKPSERPVKANKRSPDRSTIAHGAAGFRGHSNLELALKGLTG